MNSPVEFTDGEFRSNDASLAMNQHPIVFAVVLNYNGAEDTKECVNSLQRCGYPNLNIVLVDNASPDGSAAVLARTFPNLPLIRQRTNGGYSAGNNAGIRYAMENKADYVLIINHDVVVEPGFLEPMVSMMERESDIGVINPKLFYRSHPDDIFSAVSEFSYWRCTGRNIGSNRAALRSTTLECEVSNICGAALLVRSKVFEVVGLFDERFFMYFEDVEFSRRVRQKFRLAYTARSVGYHKSGGGKGWRNYTELYLYYHTRNRFLVFNDAIWLYKIYVSLFTTMNSIAKSILIFQNVLHNKERTKDQLTALWRGWKDGISIYIKGLLELVLRMKAKPFRTHKFRRESQKQS
ncbi:MAG: glycosyltransferase family 2 protein [Candidatus Nitrosotenuis sp.]